jgi:serine protease Do
MRRVLAAAVLVLAACGEAAVDAVPVAAQAPARTTADAAQHLGLSRRTAIVTAAERVAPAVVSVNVVRRERQVTGGWSLFFAPREFERTVQGLGSGFIVSSDGLVLTNQHVVAGAEQIVVTARDGTDLPRHAARKGRRSPTSPSSGSTRDDLPVAPLGTLARASLIGEWVIAIGNPYGYLLGNPEPTVSRPASISGVGRNLARTLRRSGSGVYVDMIQTDAAINPGN